MKSTYAIANMPHIYTTQYKLNELESRRSTPKDLTAQSAIQQSLLSRLKSLM